MVLCFCDFLSKSACGWFGITLEPPSPAALRRRSGRRTALRGSLWRVRKLANYEVYDAGCARKIWRFVLILSLVMTEVVAALFDIDGI